MEKIILCGRVIGYCRNHSSRLRKDSKSLRTRFTTDSLRTQSPHPEVLTTRDAWQDPRLEMCYFAQQGGCLLKMNRAGHLRALDGRRGRWIYN